MTEEEKTSINAAKDELAKALEGNNIDEIKDKTDKLTEQFHTISTKLYQQAQAQQAAGGAGFDPNMAGGAGEAPNAAPNDNVVDADFEVVDEDK